MWLTTLKGIIDVGSSVFLESFVRVNLYPPREI